MSLGLGLRMTCGPSALAPLASEPWPLPFGPVSGSSCLVIPPWCSPRAGEMVDMQPSLEATTRIKFRIATRGLLGLRNALLTATRGMGIMNTIFLEYAPMAGGWRALLREVLDVCRADCAQVLPSLPGMAHAHLTPPAHRSSVCLLSCPAGEILMRDAGSLVAFETGTVTSYALESAQERGQMFCRPGDAVYEGQCVGQVRALGASGCGAPVGAG